MNPNEHNPNEHNSNEILILNLRTQIETLNTQIETLSNNTYNVISKNIYGQQFIIISNKYSKKITTNYTHNRPPSEYSAFIELKKTNIKLDKIIELIEKINTDQPVLAFYIYRINEYRDRDDDLYITKETDDTYIMTNNVGTE